MPIEIGVDTNSQKYFGQALDHVQAVVKENKEVQNVYGGLCHKFPILVLTCGLCQAVAFVESKAIRDDDRGKAYRLLRRHVAAVLGLTEATLLSDVRKAALTEYMRHTRRIRQAWVYYKRFAVSLLEVPSAAGLSDQKDTL